MKDCRQFYIDGKWVNPPKSLGREFGAAVKVVSEESSVTPC